MVRSQKLEKLQKILQDLYENFRESLPHHVLVPTQLIQDIFEKWIFAVQRSYPEEGVAEIVFSHARFMHLITTGEPLEVYLERERALRQSFRTIPDAQEFLVSFKEGVHRAIELCDQPHPDKVV